MSVVDGVVSDRNGEITWTVTGEEANISAANCSFGNGHIRAHPPVDSGLTYPESWVDEAPLGVIGGVPETKPRAESFVKGLGGFSKVC
jgi:hypothetical protein